tara:strand:+ start:462 stop:914 length:453 start_codon:yes stop_codon:yes gene_type:complete
MNHKMWSQWKDFRLGEDYDEPDIMEDLFEVLEEAGFAVTQSPGGTFYSGGSHSKMNVHGMKYSDREAQKFAEDDVRKMGKEMNKASQKAISIMLASVKKGKYDAMDVIRAIKSGGSRVGDTSKGVPEMLMVLWSKVEKRFRKYLGGKKRR